MHRSHQTKDPGNPGNPGAWYRTRAGLAAIGFASLAALLLVYEHRLHIPFGNLSTVLPLIAIFGLHMLMHGGHGGHGGHGANGGHGGHGGDDAGGRPVAPPGGTNDAAPGSARDKQP